MLVRKHQNDLLIGLVIECNTSIEPNDDFICVTIEREDAAAPCGEHKRRQQRRGIMQSKSYSNGNSSHPHLRSRQQRSLSVPCVVKIASKLEHSTSRVKAKDEPSVSKHQQQNQIYNRRIVRHRSKKPCENVRSHPPQRANESRYNGYYAPPSQHGQYQLSSQSLLNKILCKDYSNQQSKVKVTQQHNWRTSMHCTSKGFYTREKQHLAASSYTIIDGGQKSDTDSTTFASTYKDCKKLADLGTLTNRLKDHSFIVSEQHKKYRTQSKSRMRAQCRVSM